MTSNFPNRFLDNVTIAGVPLTSTNPGKVVFVNNSGVLPAKGVTGSDGNKGNYLHPYATVNYAISQCKAGRGDIVLCMPGHSENISTAGGITFGTNTGVAVIGLGTGSLRATFNFTATAGTVTMTAASCAIKNCLFTGGITAVVSPIVVSASDCVIESCELRDVTGVMTAGILTTAAANRLRILDHVHKGSTSTGTTAAIAIVGGDEIEITARKISGCFSVAAIDVRTTATTNLFVHDVQAFRSRNNASDVFVKDTVTASTGQIGPNLNLSLNQNTANITEAITGATFRVIDPVYVVNADNEKALLINWTASADA